MTGGDIRPTWGEALLCLWEDFTGINDGKNIRTWRAACCVLLALGTVFAVLSARQMKEPQASEPFASSLSSVVPDSERASLQALAEGLREITSLRGGSASWGQNMGAEGRMPFSALPPSSALVPDLPGEEASPLPEIVVRAVMRVGGKWAAVVDIAGGGSGLVVRPGDAFMEGRGQIVRIGSGGLVVRWDGREWSVAPGLF
ncbi:MAG: hypothetical protein IJ702_08095 [Fretibacterium sp.]|nr:hypothetical protein [Fretibacterium sp.]